MFASAFTFLGSGLTPQHNKISPKNGILVHLYRYLSLFGFRLAFLHILNTLSSVTLWSLPKSLNPTIRKL